MKHKACNGTGILHGEICVACVGRGAEESEYQRLERRLKEITDALEAVRGLAAGRIVALDSAKADARRVMELCDETLKGERVYHHEVVACPALKEICSICGKPHVARDLSCNQSRLVSTLFIDLQPVTNKRFVAGMLVVLLYNVKTYGGGG